MEDSPLLGCFGILLQIVPFIAWISMGLVSWNIVEPTSFLGGIGFMILWTFLSKLTDIFLVLLITAVVKLLDK